jgi:hypothetical protein
MYTAQNLGCCACLSANVCIIVYTLLPIGRIFGRRTQKGADKKCNRQEKFTAEFWLEYQEEGRNKGSDFIKS